MKNEMPEEIWAFVEREEISRSYYKAKKRTWATEGLYADDTSYTKTELIDRRTDVDALIEAVEEMLIGLEGTLFEDAEQKRVKGLEAIQAIRGKRDGNH